MGGRNVSCVWRPDASEFGKEQTGIDESEKQAEVADRIEMELRPTP